MKIEDQIKKTVEGRVANRPSFEGAWERVQRRFHRQQRVRMTAVIAGAAAAIVSVAVVVPNLGDERKIVPIETPTAGVSETPSSSPTPAPAIPANAVAHDQGDGSTSADDRIVVVSTSTGKVVRVLAEVTPDSPENYQPFFEGLSVSADGATVYFARTGSDPDCTTRIMSVPMAGGEEREVANGWSPSVSPDGRSLAYQSPGAGPNCSHKSLVVRDLETGEERRWEWAAEDPEDPYLSGGPFSLEWSPDSRYIAFQRNVGDPLYQVWLLDTTKGTTFLDAQKISPDETMGPGPKKSWSSPAFLDDSTLIAAQETRSVHDSPEGPLHVLVTFDADNEGEPVALFDPKAAVLDISVDRVSGAVVYATGNGLFRLKDGKAVQIASGNYVAAVW